MLPPGSVPPHLVLLPGTLCDKRIFTPLLTRLTKSFHPQPISALTVMTAEHDTLRAAAEAVLCAAPHRFVLLGFSLGGLIALEIALHAPERLIGLALLNVNPASVPPATLAARRQAVLEAQSLGHGCFLRERLWTSYVAPSNRGDTRLQHTLSEMAEVLGHNAFRNQTEAALTRRDYRPLLPSLSMPALVVAGEHDGICPASLQREMAASFPDAQFALIPHAGHFALLEEADAVAVSVAAWIHHISGVGSQQSERQTLQESR
jgi:pimeloyl-ACP methyl ester carboxylesterase